MLEYLILDTSNYAVFGMGDNTLTVSITEESLKTLFLKWVDIHSFQNKIPVYIIRENIWMNVIGAIPYSYSYSCLDVSNDIVVEFKYDYIEIMKDDDVVSVKALIRKNKIDKIFNNI
jgi:hypothetical protein